MRLFWSNLGSCEYLLGKEEDKNADTFTTFPDETLLMTHATRKSHFVIIKNDREIPEGLQVIKIKEAAEILIRSMEWSCFPTVFVYAKLGEIKMSRDFCLVNTDGWRNLRVTSPNAKIWRSLSYGEKTAGWKKRIEDGLSPNSFGLDKSSGPTTFGNIKRSLTNKNAQRKANLIKILRQKSGSSNTTNLNDFDSMLMMQPSPEEKIKEKIEEPPEKVIKIENEKVKIEMEEEKEAIPSQNFGSPTIFSKSTVIKDEELKEVKPEPIDEDEFEVKPPLLKQKIDSQKEPKTPFIEPEINPPEAPKIKRSYVDWHSNRNECKRKCNLCLRMGEEFSSVINSPSPVERMILLLGMVVKGKMSVWGAQFLYKRGIETYFCRRHFQESNGYLFDALGVTSSDEICNAKAESIENILKNVELIQNTPMTAVQFVQEMEKFAELKKTEWEISKTKRAGKCCYCLKSCEESKMSRVPKSEDIRLKWFEMLGSDFERKVKSVRNAFICRSHFPPNAFNHNGRLSKGVLPCTKDEI